MLNSSTIKMFNHAYLHETIRIRNCSRIIAKYKMDFSYIYWCKNTNYCRISPFLCTKYALPTSITEFPLLKNTNDN